MTDPVDAKGKSAEFADWPVVDGPAWDVYSPAAPIATQAARIAELERERDAARQEAVNLAVDLAECRSARAELDEECRLSMQTIAEERARAEAAEAEVTRLREALDRIGGMLSTAFAAGVYDVGPPAPGLEGSRSHSQSGYAQAILRIVDSLRAKEP